MTSPRPAPTVPATCTPTSCIVPPSSSVSCTPSTCGGGHEQGGYVPPSSTAPRTTPVVVHHRHKTPVVVHHKVVHHKAPVVVHHSTVVVHQAPLATTGPDAGLLAGVGGSAVLAGAVLLAWGRQVRAH